MQSTSSEQDNKDKTAGSEQTVTIELVRHRQLFNILRNPRALWKLLGLLMVVVVLLFFVLATVALIIKRYYPYNDIYTNIYGATTLRNEDKDVTYWLFNTAEMWANSGIEVQENDIITIRTSGSWHTSIHHLVEDCDSNRLLRASWTGSDGGVKGSDNDRFRSKFRISPSDINGMLLMGVFPEEAQNIKGTIERDSSNGYNLDFIAALDSVKFDIYPIGSERTNIRILSKGVLHFAVNDIILTRKNIRKIYKAYISALPDGLLSQNDGMEIDKWIDSWSENGRIDYDRIRNVDAKYRYGDTIYDNKSQKFKRTIEFGPYAQDNRNDPIQPPLTLLRNELLYYYDNNFIDAWYVDNLGSALIIIERNHQQNKPK